MNVSLGVLAIIAFVAALYLARAFFVPLLIGILASYTLNPLVSWLKKCYIPRPIGAPLVLIALVGGLTWIVFSMRDDAAAMIEKLPEATRKMRQNLIDTRTGPTALQNMLEAVTQLEGATNDAGAEPGTRTIVVKTSEPNAWLHDYALTQSALLFEVIAQAPIVVLLTYFLLASGSHFRRKLLDLVGSTIARKDEAILMLDEITVQIQRFLLTMLVSNALVGIGIWLAFEALGMDQALVWGVAAGVLHSIPYLGPAICCSRQRHGCLPAVRYTAASTYRHGGDIAGGGCRRFPVHALVAEPVCRRKRRSPVHRLAVLRLVVGSLGFAAGCAAGCHRESHLREGRFAQADRGFSGTLKATARQTEWSCEPIFVPLLKEEKSCSIPLLSSCSFSGCWE